MLIVVLSSNSVTGSVQLGEAVAGDARARHYAEFEARAVAFVDDFLAVAAPVSV